MTISDTGGRFWLPAALVGGLLLGALDFAWIKLLPPPWGSFGNSPAAWAVVAFLLGRALRTDWRRAAAAGAVMLVTAVQAYYVTAHLWQGDDLSWLWAPVSIVWMAFGVLAGGVFGAAGALRHPIAVAMPAAVVLAEVARILYRVPGTADAGFRTQLLQFAAVQVVLAIVLFLVFARHDRPRWRVPAITAGLTVLGFLAMSAVGLGGA